MKGEISQNESPPVQEAIERGEERTEKKGVDALLNEMVGKVKKFSPTNRTEVLLRDSLLEDLRNVQAALAPEEGIPPSALSRFSAYEGLKQASDTYLKIDNIGITETLHALRDEHVDRSDTRAFMQHRVFIARNLYFQEAIPVITKETVQQESQRIVETQKGYGEVSLFQGRNVLFAAHNEFVPERGGYVFGKEATLKEIQEQQALGQKEKLQFQFERAEENTHESEERMRENILSAVRTMPAPFTFVYDGHGGPHHLYFTGLYGEIHRADINVEDLAQAFIQRYEGKKQEEMKPEERDIIILQSCYSSNFLRTFYKLLDEANVPKPISMGASEYGQVSYESATDHPYGADSMQYKILQTDSEHPATIRGVIESDSKLKDNNPSLYIPDAKNRPMQISKHEEVNIEGVA